MKSRIKVDRISFLPKNIIDSILTCLPIDEAVRTSILSRSWRHQWHSLSKITIKSWYLQVSQAELVKILDHILLFHYGSLDKFKLDVDLEIHNDIDRWILYVSRNGIKELIINKWDTEYYNLPSYLFSCSDLKYLELTRCILKTPPAAFKTFNNLTELFFRVVVITKKVLENVLNSCPLLCRLSLIGVETPPSLKIHAPKLVMLHMVGFNHYPQFMNTPLLDSATFGFHNVLTSVNENFKIVKLLGSIPILRRLELSHFALQHLAVGDVPARLPLVCSIKHLIMCINFEDLQEKLAAFCIFRSSPFIQHLELEAFEYNDSSRISTDGFWKGGHNLNFRFDHLQTVKVTWFNGTESELKFIEFLLSNAPALKTMNIDFNHDTKKRHHSVMNIKYVLDAKEELIIVKKLIRFPRISPKAELIFSSH